MAFTLAHLSDLHVGPLPHATPRQLANKRFTGYWNWHGSRRLLHDMSVLSRVIADIRTHAPDHVACTGDLANIGLPAEFETARGFMSAMGGPHDVSLVPGNHDNYVRGSMTAMTGVFQAYMRGDAGETFPFVRRRGGVALIGLSSAVTTGPLAATGALGRAQIAAAAQHLRRLREEGLSRVVMIHHPPHRAGANILRRLVDADAFTSMLAEAGAELVVHGHNHRHSVAWLQGSGRRIPAVGVASASAVPGNKAHQAHWHLYRIEGAGRDVAITLEVHGRTGDGVLGLRETVALTDGSP